MARLMSVAFTEDAVRAQTKTVTRRLGWSMLRPGDELDLCRKVMGRKNDEPLLRIARVRVTDVRREPLSLLTTNRDYGIRELDLEGFPELNAETFIDRYFTKAQGCSPDAMVTRIEWAYVRSYES